jgi:hypothetical protein
MLDLIRRAQWSQAYDLLSSGNPPMIFKLLAINTIFVVLYIIRKAKTGQSLRLVTLLQVQALLIAANVLILYQQKIQIFLGRFI